MYAIAKSLEFESLVFNIILVLRWDSRNLRKYYIFEGNPVYGLTLYDFNMVFFL